MWAWFLLGVWVLSIHLGGVQCGVPLIIWQDQPDFTWLSWSNRHSRVPLSIEVGPPSAKSVMWCNAAKLAMRVADLVRENAMPRRGSYALSVGRQNRIRMCRVLISETADGSLIS